MKKLIPVACFIVLMVAVHAVAQVPALYGLRYEMPDPTIPDSGHEQFVRINPLNGIVTVLDTVEGVEAAGLGSSTFDQVNQEYIFWGIDNQQQSLLYRLDALTGNIVNSPPLSAYPIELEFDMNSGGLFGLKADVTGLKLTSVDLNTGTLQSVDSISVSEFVLSSTSTLDATRGTYYFIGGNAGLVTRLYGLNLSSGLVVSQPAITYPAIELEYDQTQDLIFALAWNKYTENFNLLEINPFSGGISIVMEVPGLTGPGSGILSGSSIFHQESQTYLFIGVTGNQQKLYSLDVVNGIHLSSPVLSMSNVIELQVDNTIFAAARYGRPNSIAPSKLTGISVSPNPSSGFMRLVSDIPIQAQAVVMILDSKGSLVSRSIWRKGSVAFELSLHNHPEGIYLIEVHTDQGSWNSKVIVR